ncbi:MULTISPECIES: hypothetical protein [Streptomyces]|uniref:hypothetical protein n=1 Tax=Streptomyces TaxID=1883 RepID=UPI0006AF6FAA|nr:MULTISPECIES: hypothetical protein [unclassified Streptomyces]KOU70879.1 hypothetical protein ADK61_33230 [Streptomyces sp. XY66]KOV15886.1 hypothetical protein ADK90_30320 [Streptomyces sp. XY413]
MDTRFSAAGRRGRGTRGFLVAALVFGVLTGCSSEYDAADLEYAGDYSSHPPLAVVGYPTTGTLRITQQVVWRIADGKVDALASLAADEEDRTAAKKTAENWIAAFRKGAGGKVTAEFYDEGSYRQTVVLYLHATGQIKQIYVLPGPAEGRDVRRVNMREPDPAEATAVAPWVPKKPGELGSTMLP